VQGHALDQFLGGKVAAILCPPALKERDAARDA
jgi:hypothetical protein